MGRFSGLTDDELAAKILLYDGKLQEAELGGEVSVIVSDGRRMETETADPKVIERVLDQLILERDTRANGGIIPGRALGVRICKV